MRWLMKLSQYEIYYLPKVAIKGQAVVNFIVELILNKELRQLYDLTIENLAYVNSPNPLSKAYLLRLKLEVKYLANLIGDFLPK